MIAVLFELEPLPGKADAYFETAAALRPLLDGVDGFLSIERFESLTMPGKYLSLSFWRNEAAVQAWRNLPPHRSAQARGRNDLFRDYRLCVAEVVRDYGLTHRTSAPDDSRETHG
ncbi:antibiotic biosynthesis monooxygenase [Hyphomonas sp. GM-8P]|uniref:antibiotic biosynthesis monooxygenase family protein n=1 Tax=Hyphomonas sp. GM-8P TaxID=1280945 RepID=UPI000DC04BB9|nr:antibiotic biosynthesis monooxygenase [Hyphomonas sp. GM-8P]RAN38582.1 hypothetical protein HY26_03940 [Hyphomonas sp. GM-8P]